MSTVDCIELSGNPLDRPEGRRAPSAVRQQPAFRGRRVHPSAGARRSPRALLESGFAATTIRSVADSAGVSQETIYKSFGSKAALLKAVYDVALAGDADEVPLAARPEARAVLEAPTPDTSGLA